MPDVFYPMQLLQAEAAVLYIRENAANLFANQNVITCGFSAGGHLAAMTAVYYDLDIVLKTFNIKPEQARPSASILCYPVISAIANPHIGSFENLMGTKNEKEFIKCSAEFAVNKNTPPIFLWHTADDNCVNIDNSITFAKHLSDNKVPFEMHIFESGPHGLSVCDESTAEGRKELIRPDVAAWIDLCAVWLDKRFN